MVHIIAAYSLARFPFRWFCELPPPLILVPHDPQRAPRFLDVERILIRIIRPGHGPVVRRKQQQLAGGCDLITSLIPRICSALSPL